MRITEKDIENSCYSNVDNSKILELSTILSKFDKRKLNYENLKHFLKTNFCPDSYISLCDDFYTHLDCRKLKVYDSHRCNLFNFMRINAFSHWDDNLLKKILTEEITYNSNICIRRGLGYTVIEPPFKYMDYDIIFKSKIECDNFINSCLFRKYFNKKHTIISHGFSLIESNGTNPELVHSHSLKFKQFAINSVLHILFNLFPKRM